MTVYKSKYSLIDRSRARVNAITLLIFAFSLFASAVMSTYISEYVQTGLRLCYTSVIGSVFPFIILTDIFYANTDFSSFGILKSQFEKLFKINGHAIGAFICGILCGFPLGVKLAVNLFEDGIISKNECERLIAFCNNTGPAFVIAGIGVGMRGSTQDGIILYISMLISSILCGIVLGFGKTATVSYTQRETPHFDIVKSIKNAGIGTLNISSFVVFFSVICGILSLFIKNNAILSVILPFIEISNAAKTLASLNVFNNRVNLVLTSFAVSFSGISVHLQAKSYIENSGVNMQTYYFSKLLQGIFAMLFTLLFSILIS